jgi:hypothetical protein
LPPSSALADFADQLVRLADLRTVRTIAQETIERCEQGEMELDAHAIASDMENRISEGLTQPVKLHTATFAQAFEDVDEGIYARSRPELRRPGSRSRATPTGMPCAAGWSRKISSCSALARAWARPAVGAAVALGAAENGVGTDLLSLEMDRRKAARRIIAELLYDVDDPIPYEDLVAGKMSMTRWRRFSRPEEVANLPLTISDPPIMYVEDVAPHIRKRKREFEKRGVPLRLCVLDYLGRLETRKKLQGSTEIVSHISKTLKAAAKQRTWCWLRSRSSAADSSSARTSARCSPTFAIQDRSSRTPISSSSCSARNII